MLKRYTKNIYLDFYLNAADRLNIKYKPLSPFKATFEFNNNNKSLIISNAVLSVNSELSASFAKNKFKTYRLLDQKCFPRPKAVLIKKANTTEEILRLIKDIPKPWVTKPVKGMGGTGVSVNIKTRDHLEKAIKFARQYNDKIIIEEYIKGYNFRILMFQGKILDIAQRIPANIQGNGRNTIKELIDIKNKKRKKVGLKSIRVDQELHRQLTLQGLSIDHIPKNEQRILLRQSCNMAAGGETKRIEKQNVHKDNLNLFRQAVDLLRLQFGGIDFISQDITKSYKKTRGAMNEINRAPSLDVHYFADMKMDNFVAEKILEMYFNL